MISHRASQIITSIDKIILNREQRFGKNIVALVLGIIILIINLLYVCPRKIISGHGVLFARLSENPFDFSVSNPLQFRIFAPLLGYLTGFRGDLFVFIPLIFCVFFSAVLYLHYRKKNYTAAEALLSTCLISFSSVFFFNISFTGYTDIVSYFFILLCFIYIDRKIWLSIFFLCAVFNHESNLFIVLPIIIYASFKDEEFSFKKLILTLFALAVPIAVYILFRKLVGDFATVHYDTSFYFDKENIIQSLSLFPSMPLGLFFVFKLFWIFPLYCFIYSVSNRRFKDSFIIFAFVFFPLLQLIIAWDITRLLCLCFPVMLFCTDKMRHLLGAEKFNQFTFILIIANFFVPQYLIGIDGATLLLPAIIAVPYYILKDEFLTLFNSFF